MAEPKKLVTKNHRLHTARQMIESVTEPANTAYYLFVGNHIEYANISFIPQPNDSVFDTVTDVYNTMIYGKRVTSNDMKLMIPNNPYVSGVKYDMYDDRVGESNVALFSSNYYCVVNADAFYHVFKCLDNNNGANSTVQPEFADVDAEDEVYQTSDGYVWKYMYTVDNATVRKFGTTDYFPVTPNTDVQAAAKDGIINVIKVTNSGRGYDNYCNGTFRVDDLRINGNSLVYSINSSLSANTANDFYNDCYLYITSGTGVGQYSQIVDYVVNSTIKAVVLSREFNTPPAGDSTFDITPGVLIVGDGNQIVNAEARAIVNTAGNTIQRIEMLNFGLGYKFATANVLVSSVVGISNTATLRPIYSPPGGHGFDPAAELGATRLGLSVKLSNNDVGIPLTNEYRTIGILKDPMFSDVVLTISNTVGTFVPNERVYRFDKGVRICDNATVNTTSSIVQANADFVNQLYAGEYIILKDASSYMLGVVNSVANSSTFTLTKNCFFNSTETSIFKTVIGTSISSVTVAPTVLTGNVSVNTTSPNCIGTGTSFTSAVVANSYVFLYSNSTGGGEMKKITTVVNNTLLVLSSNCSFANASAKAQSIGYTINSVAEPGVQSTTGIVTSVSTGSVVLSNVSGTFAQNNMLIGELSGAVGTVDNITRSGVNKGFESFVQMYKYVGTPLTGTFEQDELVFQSSTGGFDEAFANAKLHSVVGAGPTTSYFVTEQVGIFNVGNTLIGHSSEASASITNKYYPELVFGSGEVMYIERTDPITRTNASSETIKFIFEF